MRAPSGDLVFYAVVLLGGAGFIAWGLPTTATRFQAVALAMAVCLAVEAVLLLVRFRWSPEVFAALILFIIGWGVVQGVADGFDRNRIGMSAGAVAALFGYPTLRREVRGRVDPTTPS